MNHTPLPPTLAESPVIVVVRAPHIPDAAALCTALAEGGIHHVEFTFTTPDVSTHIARATHHGFHVGVGTVLTTTQAEQAAAAGARFLITPGCRPHVAETAHRLGLPVILGALTPTEVADALDHGAAAVKIFPATAFGPRYLKDLHGPYPGTPLIASGGITSHNATNYLNNGALAVCAGTGVVPPDAVTTGNWNDITRRARAFTTAIARSRQP